MIGPPRGAAMVPQVERLESRDRLGPGPWGQLRRTGAGLQIELGATKTDIDGGALVRVPRGTGTSCPCAAIRDLPRATFGAGKKRDPAARVFGVSSKTMAQSRHRSADVAAGYTRHAEVERSPAPLAVVAALAVAVG